MGTPASMSARQEPHTLACEVEPLELTISLTVLIAYGDEVHGLRVTFSEEEQEKLAALLEQIGRTCLEEYLCNEEFVLIDLMDLCDARGVPYAFTGVGPASGIQFRPAPID